MMQPLKLARYGEDPIKEPYEHLLEKISTCLILIPASVYTASALSLGLCWAHWKIQGNTNGLCLTLRNNTASGKNGEWKEEVLCRVLASPLSGHVNVSPSLFQ